MKENAVVQSYEIPNLAELALKYDTITIDEFNHLQKVYSLKLKEEPDVSLDELMLVLSFATRYQIGLLKLIQEYLIIKKQGEAFGRISIEKGFATQEDIEKALECQKQEFKRAKLKKLIGDILVESRVITVKQKNLILREQTFLDTQVEKFFIETEPGRNAMKTVNSAVDEGILSNYEKKFLKIKALDQDFAARIIEKGFASDRQIRIARKAQEDAFEKEKKIQILGDVMVQFNFMTTDQKNLVLKDQKRIENALPVSMDSFIHVKMTKDKMEAIVKIKKDIEKVTLRDIKKALEWRQIKSGIYPDALLQCNLDMKITEFFAAGQDFSLELLKNRKVVYHFDTGKTDTQIKKMGTVLAEQYPDREVYLKKNLLGHQTEQAQGYDLAFRCASGTKLSIDRTKALAGKTGVASLSIEKKLYIHPLVTVLEDADLKYGPLEKYANLKVSGIVTGAYPIIAGSLMAREIRGARIEAIGSVTSQIGITDAFIRAQGDVRAKYLHNCRVETFGNVYVENEIMDSRILCSGKIDSGHCRVLSSTLFAKKGLSLGRVGNSRTKACVLGAGTEHHIIQKAQQIDLEIKNIRSSLDELKERQGEQDDAANKTFQKMVELKIFHDRAKNKKSELSNEFKTKKDSIKKEDLKNIVVLVQTFEKRMEDSIASIKMLNETKKKYDQKSDFLEQKIRQVETDIEKEITELQTDMFAFFEWTRQQESRSYIRIHQSVFPGTVLKGVYSVLEIETELSNFFAIEKQNPEDGFEWVLQQH